MVPTPTTAANNLRDSRGRSLCPLLSHANLGDGSDMQADGDIDNAAARNLARPAQR